MARLFGRFLFLVTALYCILCSSSAERFFDLDEFRQPFVGGAGVTEFTAEQHPKFPAVEGRTWGYRFSDVQNFPKKAISTVHEEVIEPSVKFLEKNLGAQKIWDDLDNAASKVQDGVGKFGGALFGYGNSVPAAATAVPEITMVSIIIGWVVARNIGV